jgi:hypothetical protein
VLGYGEPFRHGVPERRHGPESRFDDETAGWLAPDSGASRLVALPCRIPALVGRDVFGAGEGDVCQAAFLFHRCRIPEPGHHASGGRGVMPPEVGASCLRTRGIMPADQGRHAHGSRGVMPPEPSYEPSLNRQ